jgi:hypothetical protein
MLKINRKKVITLLIVAILVMAVPASTLAAPAKGLTSQPISVTGSIVGTVTNTAGAPVPGAFVVALPCPFPSFPVPITADNIQQIEQVVIARGYGYAFTDQYGQYGISGLSPGTYAEFVLKVGYVPAWRYGIVVSSGQETVEDFTLAPAVLPVTTK